jgi:hypothetical protein
MRTIPTNEVTADSLHEKIGLPKRDAAVGVFVLAGYAAGLVALVSKIPTPIIVINGILWLFFFWYWQRNLRRTWWGKRQYVLATTRRSLVVPVVHADKHLSDMLERVIEIPLVEIRQAVIVRQHMTLGRKRASRYVLSAIPTCSLRLELRDEVANEVRAFVDAVRALPGFQAAIVAIPDEKTIELVLRPSQVRAVSGLLSRADPRLAPRTEESIVNLLDADDAQFATAVWRLEAMGEQMAARAARRQRDEDAPKRLARDEEVPKRLGR